MQEPLKSTPEYTRTVEKRQTLLKEAKDEWWKLEVEAMRAEMKDTVDEVKIQTHNVQEILKYLRGVQDSLDWATTRNATIVHAAARVCLSSKLG